MRQDGSITFSDWAGDQGGRDAQYRRAYGSLTVDDVWKFERITVTSHGRLAGQSPRPTVAINIEKVDLVVLLDRIEDEIEASTLEDDVKEEARSKLRLARDAVAGVSRTAATEAISAALRHVLGLP